MPFVIDASVALASCFEDERSEYTDAVLRALSTGELAYAPALWPLEVLDGLLVAERRKRLKREDVGLAQRRGLALATVDKRLAAAAQNFGIRVFRSSEQ